MPQRRCLLTGQRAEAETLLRFAIVKAVGAVGEDVVPDPAHRLPGRGLWLAPAPGAVATVMAKGLFARAAKRKLQVPADLPVRSQDAWTAHVAGQVTKARLAGLVLAEGQAEADTVSADATLLGLGRLALKRTPLTRRAVADLALLVRLVG
jgi:predicted RNA-binding protein YlxR (DUF448 family)